MRGNTVTSGLCACSFRHRSCGKGRAYNCCDLLSRLLSCNVREDRHANTFPAASTASGDICINCAGWDAPPNGSSLVTPSGKLWTAARNIGQAFEAAPEVTLAKSWASVPESPNDTIAWA